MKSIDASIEVKRRFLLEMCGKFMEKYRTKCRKYADDILTVRDTSHKVKLGYAHLIFCIRMGR